MKSLFYELLPHLRAFHEVMTTELIGRGVFAVEIARLLLFVVAIFTVGDLLRMRRFIAALCLGGFCLVLFDIAVIYLIHPAIEPQAKVSSLITNLSLLGFIWLINLHFLRAEYDTQSKNPKLTQMGYKP